MYYNLKESGMRIKKLRKQRGFTQEQLSERLNSSVSNMSKIEIGYSGLSIDLLIELASFFDVSVDYILFGKELYADNLKRNIRIIIDELIKLEEEI